MVIGRDSWIGSKTDCAPCLGGEQRGPMKDLEDLSVLSLDNQVGMALVLMHSVTTEGLCEFRVFYCALHRVWPWAEVRVVARCLHSLLSALLCGGIWGKAA